MNPKHLPELKYQDNEQKKLTLHLFFQIIGKIRMEFTPRKNHWWYITLYVNEKGFTTGPIQLYEGYESFAIDLNILKHQLEISKSTGEFRSFKLENSLSIASFYQKLKRLLEEIDIRFDINKKPYELNIEKDFSEITEIQHYDSEYSLDFWKTFLWVDSVFKEFSGRFYGKTCPVHLYWHSLDLAVTRFSGKKAPAMPEDARISDKDAYTHECISFGFWGGDEKMPEAAFYSYTYPSPENLEKEKLQPESADWQINNGSPMAILKYKDLLEENNPREVLLGFLESAYQAGAKLAGWPTKELKVPPLGEL